ncbi:salicylate carboxymethyltransferase-like isoform X1 [Cucurbita pepo subsp. pepo]|uniref:salicylate carboxymethyltransferase-like isoform X1 n=1 Tax=Cucurbita pepo subsp. pepo TaxID=3664 RepID=UPI000C9D34EC|nr:salicylate carboxymethyltransferase-like isoform X1 [Cucurbita pepo subsp. pepo]
MEVAEVLHMNGGVGDLSYATNSRLQSKVISMTMPIAEEAIVNLYCSTFPTTLTIADLGCSSGPNALMPVSQLLEAVEKARRKLRKEPIEYQVLLNDLPGNDFNTIFKSLPSFLERLKMKIGADLGPCLVTGVPGSFYGRLFPSHSVHFIHSSYSLHWLSKVPEGLEENKRNIFMAETSPESVLRAYYDQFQKDFSLFLKCRAQELVGGGCMIFTLPGRKSQNPASRECSSTWELLAVALNDMVSQGKIEVEKLESFNIPKYKPTPTEIEIEVAKEGSFVVDGIRVWDVSSNQFSNNALDGFKSSSDNVAKGIRAIAEPILASHFGDQIMDELFIKYGEIIADRKAKEKPSLVNVTVSLTKPK